MTDLDHIIKDKYEGDASIVTDEDRSRLAGGEPVAYVIGWIPFLGLRIYLDHNPLIPRPETEWWTEELVTRAREHFPDQPTQILDLCAGSGAIGLSLLHALPQAHVYFVEQDNALVPTIQKNIQTNNLDPLRATIFSGDLFENVPEVQFDLIACNPPYIPSARVLDASVINFEPTRALFSGPDGLDLIRRIAQEAPAHIKADGELWLETDISNSEETKSLLEAHGAKEAVIRNDQYGRPRLVIAYY
jgi:release factor glutamine methyltransferase